MKLQIAAFSFLGVFLVVSIALYAITVHQNKKRVDALAAQLQRTGALSDSLLYLFSAKLDSHAVASPHTQEDTMRWPWSKPQEPGFVEGDIIPKRMTKRIRFILMYRAFQIDGEWRVLEDDDNQYKRDIDFRIIEYINGTHRLYLDGIMYDLVPVEPEGSP